MGGYGEVGVVGRMEDRERGQGKRSMGSGRDGSKRKGGEGNEGE